ncbi:MAG: dihydropteroate synthase [Pseudomonadota bacterium]
MNQATLAAGRHTLSVGEPVVMGILNVTPDSFSDGGRHLAYGDAVTRAREMVAEGAAIIDVGGESTRPGAAEVSVEDELRRVIPVVEALAPAIDVPISIDTSKPEVMRAAAAAGAGIINDVYALRRPGALAAAAATGLPVCLMHMQGEPRTMQANPRYENVVADVHRFLAGRADACRRAGIEQLILDPGFGFGKRLEHNLILLGAIGEFATLGAPVLVGVSRKSMFGQLLGRDVDERLAGGLAAAMLSADRGARIIRTHDVAPTVDALRVRAAVRAASADGIPQSGDD